MMVNSASHFFECQLGVKRSCFLVGIASLCTIGVISVERYVVVSNPMGAVLFQTRYTHMFIWNIRTFRSTSHDRFLPSSDMLLPGWCSPGSGRLYGIHPLSLDGVVLTLRGLELPVLRTGTAKMWGTRPSSSYTCCFALLCHSLLSWRRTRSFCGPSTR